MFFSGCDGVENSVRVVIFRGTTTSGTTTSGTTTSGTTTSGTTTSGYLPWNTLIRAEL